MSARSSRLLDLAEAIQAHAETGETMTPPDMRAIAATLFEEARRAAETERSGAYRRAHLRLAA